MTALLYCPCLSFGRCKSTLKASTRAFSFNTFRHPFEPFKIPVIKLTMVLVNSVYVIFSVSHFLAPWLLVNTILVTVIFYLKLRVPVTISTDRGLTPACGWPFIHG
jgi:hypothetical protein